MHTWRSPHQSVHFHVDLNFSEEEFLNDWTAAHELSHLSIAYLGGDLSWFAEGYASFWQYQIMKTQGVFDQNKMEKKYSKKWSESLSSYRVKNTFPKQAMELKTQHNYPDMYWGSAYFFYILNEKLKKENTSMKAVMNEFLACCRFSDQKVEEIIKSWNEISSGSNLQELYLDFQNQPAQKFLKKYYDE